MFNSARQIGIVAVLGLAVGALTESEVRGQNRLQRTGQGTTLPSSQSNPALTASLQQALLATTLGLNPYAGFGNFAGLSSAYAAGVNPYAALYSNPYSAANPAAGLYRLRAAGRHVVEVTSFADAALGIREFVLIFVSLTHLMTALSQDADALVIGVHPRHGNFYRKVLGFVPLGTCRAYPMVDDHPAEGYFVDEPLLWAKAPRMHETMLGRRLPPQALAPTRMARHLVQYFGSQSTPECSHQIGEIFEFLDAGGNPRRW
jgi:hypothetical protein